ncbi:hypothetical protein JNUCC23_10410 [Peribacillus sp. JNUCC 23]
MKGIKAFIAVSLLGILLAGLSACGGNDKGSYFSNEEEALKHFIQKEDVKGNIDLVTTVKDEKLLVTQTREKTYFVGELAKDKNGYYTERISDNVAMEDGGSWELNTLGGNEYTIYFEKDKEDLGYIQLSNGEYNTLLVKGHTITKKGLTLTSAIKRVEVVKD